MAVPANKRFFVRPTRFMGPCSSSSITVQIKGQIIAPNMNQFNTKTMWIVFSSVNGLVLTGTGGFSGSATFNDWWRPGLGENRPAALRILGCTNVIIKGLTFVQPPRAHIAITSCTTVTITNIQITAPQNSENTDGIDISGSSNINIQQSNIQTGDDCVAINGGCSNINITNVNCGPGHGISIGSLGRDAGIFERVENIHVKNCTFTRTQNAARIKTVNEGNGFARMISYENIVLVDVQNPIIIKQNYCVKQNCPSQPSKVKVRDVSFRGFRGTTVSDVAINLKCSASTPCENIKLEGINIRSSYKKLLSASCSNAYGTSNPSNVPTCSCLKQKLSF
ncbi:probable polygalacturonase At3g15720 [Impatiens glandulifera]|uniref:probable polygalacturonase At3g15720 n=1 Tax=Impatiens glandulifera TaxID=253017 RepID=UPI001FB0E26E|nr:probable polygalacturonase At3g15720 [Impatiens glandulifera]